MTHPDVKLLLQCRRGSDRAARALWADHARSVRACARALTRDPHAADDIVQHVFCSILEADRAALKRVRDVRAYLVGAARNESMSYLRGERRRLARETVRKTTADGTERMDELAGAMSALSDEHREVLLLKGAGGLTFDQLALALGMNRSTAASRHRAALARLRELLDAHQDSPQDRNAPIMRTEAQHARS